MILIPAYNEEETVEEVIEEVILYKNPEIDLLVINDGSTDSTGKILRELKKKYPFLLLENQENCGYGFTLFRGFQEALKRDVPFLLTMDCDKQHEPKDIPRFLSLFQEKKIFFINGSRYKKEKVKGIPAPIDRKKINQRITQILQEIACKEYSLSFSITDAFCGMRLYRKEFLKDFVSFFSSLEEKEYGYGFPLVLWLYFFYWVKRKKIPEEKAFEEIAIARIYLTDSRSFGEDLDAPLRRYRYYLSLIKRMERILKGRG